MNPGDLVLVDTAPLNPATVYGWTKPLSWAKPDQTEWYLVTFATECMRTIAVERLTPIDQATFSRLAPAAIAEHDRTHRTCACPVLSCSDELFAHRPRVRSPWLEMEPRCRVRSKTRGKPALGMGLKIPVPELDEFFRRSLGRPK